MPACRRKSVGLQIASTFELIGAHPHTGGSHNAAFAASEGDRPARGPNVLAYHEALHQVAARLTHDVLDQQRVLSRLHLELARSTAKCALVCERLIAIEGTSFDVGQRGKPFGDSATA